MSKPTDGTLRLRYAARSDIGLVREGNEDSGYGGGHMLMVADGMGGHAAGELASSTAVAMLAELDRQPPGNGVLNALSEATNQTHDELAKVIAENPAFLGMGTTITAISWEGDRVAIAHIGDSRAYLLRNGTLTQITKDHTYVQTLVDAGEITHEQAATHPKRNLLIKALDGVHQVEPDLSMREVQPGDRFLMCTDGLTGVVNDTDIAAILTGSDPTGAVGALVEKALEGGAPDNVTCVVADLILDDNSSQEIPGPDDDEEDLNNTLAIPIARSGPMPVVVGAAAELRNRDRLPGIEFPEDSEPDPENPAGEDSQSSSISADGIDPTATPAASSGDGKARGNRLLSCAVPIVGAIVLLAAVLVGFNVWVNNQYYVGDRDGRITIFQGIPEGVGSQTFSSPIQTSETLVESLPKYSQEQVTNNIHSTDGLDGARRITLRLEAQAKACVEASPRPSGCPDPTTGEVTQ